jgi:hypothetical protein
VKLHAKMSESMLQVLPFAWAGLSFTYALVGLGGMLFATKIDNSLSSDFLGLRHVASQTAMNGKWHFHLVPCAQAMECLGKDETLMIGR